MSEDLTQADIDAGKALDALLYAHHVIKYDPKAAQRCAEQAFRDHRLAAAKAIQERCAKVAASATAYDDRLNISAGCGTTGSRIAAAIRALNQEETP